MPINNFKLFDEKKANMMSDDDYAINQQRLNGVQSGVASSQLQNKTLYQTALMCYALAQLMAANGYDANDADAVSTFVNNLSLSMVQKVVDKASANDVASQTAGKWVDAKQLGELKKDVADNYLPLLGGTMLGDLFLNRDPVSSLQAATKQYVDRNDVLVSVGTYVGKGGYGISSEVTITFPFLPTAIFMPNNIDNFYAQPVVFFDDLPDSYSNVSVHDSAIEMTKGKVLIKKNISNKSISFYYNETSGTIPFNRKNVNYKWMAIYKKLS